MTVRRDAAAGPSWRRRYSVAESITATSRWFSRIITGPRWAWLRRVASFRLASVAEIAVMFAPMPDIVSNAVQFGNESLVVASDPATCPEMDSGATGADSGDDVRDFLPIQLGLGFL